MSNPKTAKLAEFFGLKRNLVLLFTATIVIAAGEEMWVRFVPKYLETLGASLAIIGLYDAIRTVVGAVYAYPGGALSDHWGQRRALIFFHALSTAGYVLMFVFEGWPAVLAGTFLFLAWSTLSLPAMFSMVAMDLAPSKHAMGIGIQSLIRRIPVIAGPLAGGVLLDRYGIVDGVRIGLAVSIVLGLISVGIQAGIAESPRLAHAESGGLRHSLRTFDPRLKRLLISDILVRYCERLPAAWVVIYAMNNAGASATQVGMLTAVEMAVAIACYIPVAHYADRKGKEPFVVLTFAFFTLFPVTLWLSTGFGWLLVAFVVRGLKEFGDPARKALIIAYAPVESRGRAVGAYYLVRDLTVSTGAFAGAALWAIGPEWNFGAAAAIGAIGTAIYVKTLKA
jgi:MFS family permease